MLSNTHPIRYNRLESVCNLFGQSVILENVNDPDKNEESLALLVCGWDATLEVGVGRQRCRFLITSTQFFLGFIQVVDAQEKRVVHVVVALEKTAVLLYGGHQSCVGVGINPEAFWDHVKEIKILEGWKLLCPLLCGCLKKMVD